MNKTKSHTGMTRLNKTNKYYRTNKSNLVGLTTPLSLLSLTGFSLFALTLLSGTILMSNSVNAANDSVVDEINIAVPVSCTLSGSGMTSHTTSIPNGTYNSSIGETIMKAFCNDNGGFAIYAIGYTDNEDGKNVLTSSTLGSDYDIVTGTALTGNSQWAMKLETESSATYPISIQNSFDSFHEVPNDYVLVAKRTAGTDTGTNAEGSTLITTYQAYIDATQPAGTYTGQVKYILVHPHDTEETPVRDDQIAVIYNSNDLAFPGGIDKNRVVYSTSCTPMYMGTVPEVVETSNLTNGIPNGSYTDHEDVLQSITLPNADKVKVVVDYGITANTMYVMMAEDIWDGDWDNMPDTYDEIYDNLNNISGTESYIFNGDTVTIDMISFNAPEVGYDYGVYARFYPIYATEESDTEEIPVCSYTATGGAYTQTTTQNDKWFATVDGEVIWFSDENAIKKYLSQNEINLLGTTLYIYAYNPYRIVYNGNGATAGTMNGFYTNLDTQVSTADLMTYNFKRTGYGFAGWSEDPNATVNSTDIVYGPNEMVRGDELAFDSSHETTLYAVWVPSGGNMQNYSCSSLSSGQVVALTDMRDGNVYTVGKMQDGNCWMMENLRLDDTAVALSSANTNNPLPAFTSLSHTNDNWCSQAKQASCVDQSMLNTNNTNIGGTNSLDVELVVDPEESGDHSQWYGYGNYYNWYSATAGRGTYNVSSGNATGDICPLGWHLPYGGNGTGVGGGGTSGGFSYLDVQMGGTGDYQNDFGGDGPVGTDASNRWRSYPNNFVYSGAWWGWSEVLAKERSRKGYYWSLLARDRVMAYTMIIHSDQVNPSFGGNDERLGKLSGQSVRCVLTH